MTIDGLHSPTMTYSSLCPFIQIDCVPSCKVLLCNSEVFKYSEQYIECPSFIQVPYAGAFIILYRTPLVYGVPLLLKICWLEHGDPHKSIHLYKPSKLWLVNKVQSMCKITSSSHGFEM